MNTHYYIHGQFIQAQDPNGEWVAKSPADLSDVLGTIRYSYRAVEDAVTSARQAIPGWRKKSFFERAEFIKKYQDAIKRRSVELTKLLAKEVGKPLWESELEIKQTLEIIDFFLEKKTYSSVDEIEVSDPLPGSAGFHRQKPLGVVAVISPFNTPAKISSAHMIPALMTGNTVIHKPSEKATLFSLMLAECIHEAGFPPGVYNLVAGDKEVGRRLSAHEGVQAVFFAGSYDTGLRIKQETLQQYWKFLALEMGGKNPMIVCKDAAIESALQAAIVGAFMSTGQRCSATSRILVERSLMDEFVSKFHAASKRFSIDHPLKNPFMGPLIDALSVDRFLKFHAIAIREGGEFVMRGKTLELEKQGHYVTPAVCRFKDYTADALKKSVFHQTEFFAPMVSLIPFDDLDHALSLAGASQYGLVASVFTQSKETFEQAYEQLEYGMIYWNKATVGSSNRLPYGGWKKSGNHRPMGSEAPIHCMASVAVLHAQPESGAGQNYPGLNWQK